MKISTLTLIAMIGFSMNAAAQTNVQDSVPIKTNNVPTKKPQKKPVKSNNNNPKTG